jgi:hypothetical protein
MWTASVGRTTAYRYFPNSRALLAATFPELEMDSLLGADPPEDPLERATIVAESLAQRIIEHEPEYRAQLRLALEGEPAGSESLPLRRGRRIAWVEDALSALRGRMPEPEWRRLIYGIGATIGIEAFVWLTDMGGLSLEDANGDRGVKEAFLKDAALCVGKTTKQSQTTDFALFPQCYISGCSDVTGRQYTSSRVEVRWLTSTYRSAHELTTVSRGACSAARSPRRLTHDALQQPLGVSRSV